MNEQNIFELLREPYHLPKKVKLFEAFAGIGCQRLAFNRLGIEVDPIGISEIDKYAIASYNAIHGETKNWGSICDIKGKDLPQIDVFTWSFPCTDLSKAGKQSGLQGGTRSGLVYEVLRILHEATNKPKVLIMENVVDLVQCKFIREFQEIQLELEGLGYSNYAQTLNAKHYGVAQNRDRIFMVSVLGDKYYEFPKPIKLEKRLKDYLENYVDEKYYLSDKQITSYKESSYGCMRRENDIEDVCQTIDTMQGGNREPKILIPEDTKKGYSKAYEGDGVYINRPQQKCGVVQQGLIQTLKTSCADVGVVVDPLINQLSRGYNEGGNFELCPPITSNSWQENNRLIENKLRIRKLTPKECFALMGINSDEYEKASKVVSNSQLYKQAGNGIVVDVFAAIIKNLI